MENQKEIQPLIDGDILLHELGWSGEFKDKDSGEEILFDFEKVRDMLDEKIKLICNEVEATKHPIIFVTDSPELSKMVNRERKFRGLEPLEFTKGFRYDIAKTKPYKGTRSNPKPFHFYNILAYLLANYDVVVARDGYEADDLICHAQYHALDVKDKLTTVICSRDKDLRICPGWHYSWECGKQGSIGPIETDKIGWLEKTDKKVLGYGLAFFYYQMLVGDAADNIPGLPGWGEAKAFKCLESTPYETEMDLFSLVKSAYKHNGMSKEYFMEQANLLWMRMDKQPYKIPKG